MKYPKSVKSVFFFIGVLHYKLRARKTVHGGVVNEHFFFRCGSISATEFFPRMCGQETMNGDYAL